MTAPKRYKYNTDVPISTLIKSGFHLVGNTFKFRSTLYRYDNTDQPYVELTILIDGDGMTETVTCNRGDIYIPFINPETRHNNLVYEKVVTNYNNVMDKLCKAKILRHVKGKHHG